MNVKYLESAHRSVKILRVHTSAVVTKTITMIPLRKPAKQPLVKNPSFCLPTDMT